MQGVHRSAMDCSVGRPSRSDGPPGFVAPSASTGGPSLRDGPVEELSLRVEGRDEKLRFFLRQGDGEWRQIGGEEKADVLTTGTAGGFIGATVGMYATRGR